MIVLSDGALKCEWDGSTQAFGLAGAAIEQITSHLRCCREVGAKIERLQDQDLTRTHLDQVPFAPPSPEQLEADLRTVRQAADIVVECEAVAIASGATIHDVLNALQGRISSYEREVDAMSRDLREAKAEAELVRTQCLAAEAKLETLAAAVERMAGVLPQARACVDVSNSPGMRRQAHD